MSEKKKFINIGVVGYDEGVLRQSIIDAMAKNLISNNPVVVGSHGKTMPSLKEEIMRRNGVARIISFEMGIPTRLERRALARQVIRFKK